jgi:hypothetical protein
MVCLTCLILNKRKSKQEIEIIPERRDMICTPRSSVVQERADKPGIGTGQHVS